jgi:hypothetical protein
LYLASSLERTTARAHAMSTTAPTRNFATAQRLMPEW